MSDQDQAIVPSKTEYRARVLVLGGIIGTVLGIISAVLYLRAAEETHGEEAPEMPQARDALKLGVSLLAIIRSITEWGKR